MRAYRTVATVAAVLATVVVAGGCSGTGGDGDSDGSSAPDKVTYLTAFNAFGRESYVWVAEEKGFFAKANLDVEIKIGNGSGENMTALAGGQADFAPVDSTGYMLWIGTGKVKGITAVSAIQQRSMVGLMTLDGYDIRTPGDLAGKTIGSPDGATDRILFPTYAKLAGLDPDQVRHQNLDSGQVFGALAQHRVDAIGQFVVGKPLAERAAKGKKAIPLPYSDVMTDLYGHFLLTSAKRAQQKPDLVKRFTGALLSGLRYAIEHPEEAGQILNRAVPEQDPGIAAEELHIMSSYTRTAGGKLGLVEEDRVLRVIALLAGAGAIPAGKKARDFVRMDLVPKT